MQLTSRITGIEPAGNWSNGQRTFNKFKVSFANGDVLNFLAVNDFKAQVGQDLTYEKNEQYMSGKIVRDQQPQQSYSKSKEDTQVYIIRQSMIKAAIDYHATNPNKTEDQIIQTARNFVNFVNNG